MKEKQKEKKLSTCRSRANYVSAGQKSYEHLMDILIMEIYMNNFING